jgi:hypothetical protein
MANPSFKTTLFLVAATLVAVTTFMVDADAQLNQGSELELTAPFEPLRPGVAESEIFAELVARNQLRSAALLDYTAQRTYQVVDLNGKVHAEEIGRMDYRAPDKKSFAVTSEKGSGLIRRMALNPLIASEIEAASGKEHHDSSITPANYDLKPLGEQQVGPTVIWGQQSWDEMVGFFNLVYDPRISPKDLLPEKKVVANSKASIADH